MVIIQRSIQGVPVLELDGVLGVGNSEALDARMKALGHSGHVHVVLDMRHVRHVDSTGLSMLVASRAVLQRVGGEVRLAGVNNRVSRIFEVTRLAELFAMDLSVHDAVTHIAPHTPMAA